MKRLTLVRHAKSSWNHHGISDFDRPLNQQGEREAHDMGKRLAEREILPDSLITSPAKRARQTAEIIAPAIGYETEVIEPINILYGANLHEMHALIEKLNDSMDHVLIIGHNPTWTELANHLTGATIFNIPTCGVAHLELNIQTWNEIHENCANLLHFDFPNKGRLSFY